MMIMLISHNHTNSISFLESLPNVEITNETKSFSGFSSNDVLTVYWL